MGNSVEGPDILARAEQAFLRWSDRLNRVIYYLIAALFAGMCLLALLQVISRLSLNIPGLRLSMPWSEELGRSLMIWLVFLGAAYASRVGQMIALTFVADSLPPSLQRGIDVLSATVCIGFYLLMVNVGLKATSFGWMELSPVLQFPKAYIYYAMPVGAAIMIINTLALLVERGLFHTVYLRSSGNGDVGATGGTQE